MFWLAVVAYLLMSYGLGGLICFGKLFNNGYTPFGSVMCFIASPFWLAGVVIGLMGLLLISPLIYFHCEQPKDVMEEIVDDVFVAKKKYKPKFGAKNKCEIKEL